MATQWIEAYVSACTMEGRKLIIDFSRCDNKQPCAIVVWAHAFGRQRAQWLRVRGINLGKLGSKKWAAGALDRKVLVCVETDNVVRVIPIEHVQPIDKPVRDDKLSVMIVEVRSLENAVQHARRWLHLIASEDLGEARFAIAEAGRAMDKVANLINKSARNST